MRAPFISLLVWVCLCFVPSTSHAAAIHDAAKKGDVGAISAALDAGANINEFDRIATPLYYAVEGAQLDAAKLLMERGADVNTLSALSLLWSQPLPGATSRLYDCYSSTMLIQTRGATCRDQRGDQPQAEGP